jgi:hypothetical protein
MASVVCFFVIWYAMTFSNYFSNHCDCCQLLLCPQPWPARRAPGRRRCPCRRRPSCPHHPPTLWREPSRDHPVHELGYRNYTMPLVGQKPSSVTAYTPSPSRGPSSSTRHKGASPPLYFGGGARGKAYGLNYVIWNTMATWIGSSVALYPHTCIPRPLDISESDSQYMHVFISIYAHIPNDVHARIWVKYT